MNKSQDASFNTMNISLSKLFHYSGLMFFYDLKFSMTILICMAMKNCGVHNLCGTTKMSVVLIQLTIKKPLKVGRGYVTII